jgi:hypothetical protein
LKGKGYFFLENQNVMSHRGGGGGPCQFHQMTHGGGGGGSKIAQKSVTYYLNGPLRQFYLFPQVPPLFTLKKVKSDLKNILLLSLRLRLSYTRYNYNLYFMTVMTLHDFSYKIDQLISFL